MSNKSINNNLIYTGKMFQDNFNRTDTYSGRTSEVSDGNNWLAFGYGGSHSNCGISSGQLLLNVTGGQGETVGYRRNLEDYSKFTIIIHEFEFTADNTNIAYSFALGIGAANIIGNYVENLFDGIMFKYCYDGGKVIKLCNGSNKASTPFTFAANTKYKIKFVCSHSFMGVKIWLATDSEPSSYTLQYSGTLTTNGTYLNYCASYGSTSGTSTTYIIDNHKTNIQ